MFKPPQIFFYRLPPNLKFPEITLVRNVRNGGCRETGDLERRVVHFMLSYWLKIKQIIQTCHNVTTEEHSRYIQQI